MRTRLLTMTLLVLTALALTAAPLQAKPPSQDPDVARTLAQVRQATARFHDLQAAKDAGYGPQGDCVEGMGYHYARGIAASADDLDPLDPEILVYAPRPNGTLRLVAVEYGVLPSGDPDAENPTLFGQVFADPTPPFVPFHTLHAWVWQGNPAGIFEAHNPNIRC